MQWNVQLKSVTTSLWKTLSYKLAEATQNDESTYEQVKAKEMFGKVTSKTEVANISTQSQVTYDPDW